MHAGRLLFPALRWSDESGYEDEAARIAAALARGVGGFILFGGNPHDTALLIEDLRRRSSHPLLIGADLERGAGQQFHGATSLPPLAAFGALDDLDMTRRAAGVTAREARAIGVDWIYAPVADVDFEPRNPIVGTRAFGSDPDRVADHVAAWVEGCRAAGALSCAKHFPGHGRTVADSHAELPVVDATRVDLQQDLKPFRAAIQAGTDAIMTAHVAYPALDEDGTPATLSRRIISGVLREELRYDGIVVTDALDMQGVLDSTHGQGEAAVRALKAGCDALLFVEDPAAVHSSIERAVAAGEISIDRIGEALRRIDVAASRVAERETTELDEGDATWALHTAIRTCTVVRGNPRLDVDVVCITTVDDDLGGPSAPPSRAHFAVALRQRGVEPIEPGERDSSGRAIVAVYSDIRAWKGRPGLSVSAIDRVEQELAKHPDALIVLFGHPRLAAQLPGETILAAWGGEPLMQRAAAHWISQRLH